MSLLMGARDRFILGDNRFGLRPDLALVASMIEPESRLLDVGCGDGALLDYLVRQLSCDGRGVEISQAGVNACVARGLPAVQGDADRHLADYPDNSFDCVILSQTLQAVSRPREVLRQMMRIADTAIVSILNYGHISARVSLVTRGRMPHTRILSEPWFESSAIRPCTVRDFMDLVRIEKLATGACYGIAKEAGGHRDPPGFRGSGESLRRTGRVRGAAFRKAPVTLTPASGVSRAVRSGDETPEAKAPLCRDGAVDLLDGLDDENAGSGKTPAAPDPFPGRRGPKGEAAVAWRNVDGPLGDEWREHAVLQQAVDLALVEGKAVTERRVVGFRPQSATVGDDDDEAARRGEDAPQFAHGGGACLAVFQGVDREDAVEGVIGQGQGILVGEADSRLPLARPADHALHGRGKGKDPLRLAGKDVEEGGGVAQTHDTHAGDIGPAVPDAGQHQAPRDLSQAAAIEGIEIGDILVHGSSVTNDAPTIAQTGAFCRWRPSVD